MVNHPISFHERPTKTVLESSFKPILDIFADYSQNLLIDTHIAYVLIRKILRLKAAVTLYLAVSFPARALSMTKPYQ